MKKFLLMMILVNPLNVTAKEMTAAEMCIAGDSGVGSVECLEKLYKTLNQELDQLNQAVVSSLEERNRKDTITIIHYNYALVAFKRSVLDFKLYRESSCNTFTYYSGGVASGYQQQLYKCLISQTEIHNQFLKTILKI